MASAVETASSRIHRPHYVPAYAPLPTVVKIIFIAAAFFIPGCAAERKPFVVVPCMRPTYVDAWSCPTPEWAQGILAQFPRTEHFSMETPAGETVTALVGVRAPSCPGATRYVRATCPTKTPS